MAAKKQVFSIRKSEKNTSERDHSKAGLSGFRMYVYCNVHLNLYQVIQKLYEIKLSIKEQLFKSLLKGYFIVYKILSVCSQKINRTLKIPNI